MYVIKHTLCGSPAFLYAVEPIPGTVIKREHFRTLDQEKVTDLGRVRCCTCGVVINGVSDLEPGGPLLKTYDMGSDEDMKELYGHG